MTSRWVSSLVGVALTITVASAPARAATPWLPEFVDRAVRSGVDAKVSPNLSYVLGLATTSEATAVRQFVVREGSLVRTFNVCTGDHKKIVLMTIDEEKHATTAFLISSKGTLRKAVSYTSGGPSALVPEGTAKPALRHELDFWSQQHP